MRKIECKNEGCTSFYDGEFPDNDWVCLTCKQPPSKLFHREKSTRQDVLRSESTNRTRVRYWMRWSRTEGIRLGLTTEPILPKRRSREPQ